MALYNLASNRNYGDLQDEMIRDRLVIGIRNNSLSEQLQMEVDLMLERPRKPSDKKSCAWAAISFE